MKISINTLDMSGELYQTTKWECLGPNCLNGFKAKLAFGVLEQGMKINTNDQEMYGFRQGEEIQMSRFEIRGIEVNYDDNSKTKIGIH